MSIASYTVTADKVRAEVEIVRDEREFVPIYRLKLPKIKEGTLALLDEIKKIVVVEIPIKTREILAPKSMEELKEKFYQKCVELLRKKLGEMPKEKEEFLAGMLIQEMLGLGRIELLLGDGELEEIVINSSKEPVWVYHKKYGWLKTNITIPQEADIENYAAGIGRKVGRQITTLNPLLDAHLLTGDRVNATLFPISTEGNTITIRMFRRKPWTITDFIENRTVSSEIVALLWLAIQYEMNMIISGGTASGKTSFLNTLMPFIPPNHRIISIEDTREISLPEFLHWIPMTTREPNPEGKGEISMLDLLVNSLRMRPDRIIVGEIRRSKEAEVLFEAMHTGHSVYATLHADTAEQTYKRLVNPPISVPPLMIQALDLLVVMFRDRRKGIRRIYEVAELVPAAGIEGVGAAPRILFRWRVARDVIEKYQESRVFLEKLKTFTGMSDKDINKDLEEKKKILDWMLKNKINTVNAVGRLVAKYYDDPAGVLRIIKNPKSKPTDLIPKRYLEG